MANPAAVKIIKEFEGLSLTPYVCPAGILTVGYGATRINGRLVRSGDVITAQQAEDLLDQDIATVEKQLQQTVPYWSEMNKNQQAALISFAFNLGSAFMSASNGFNTIQKVLRRRDWKAVPEALLLYVKTNGKVLQGLKRRRQAEGELWSAPLTQPRNKKENYFLLAIEDTFFYKDYRDPNNNITPVMLGQAFMAEEIEQKVEYGAYLKVWLDRQPGECYIYKEHWAL